MRLVALVAISVSAVFGGANGFPDNWCREGSFLHDPDYRTASVTGRPDRKIYFNRDLAEGVPDGDCPDLKLPACRAPEYVVPGNRLLISRSYRGFACAWYSSGTRRAVGWLPESNLKPLAALPEPIKWIGLWRSGDDEFRIAAIPGSLRLRVKGKATWHGLGDVRHYGSVSGEAVPSGDKLTVDESPCQVTLRRAGVYLIASDNSQCGGANVHLEGVFPRNF